MKRLWSIPLLLLCAVAVYASTVFSIDPSEMKNGESKKLVDGDRTITVTKNGDAVDVRIEGAGSSKTLTITRGHDGFRIERSGGESFIMPPTVETFTMPKMRTFRYKNGPAAQSWFVCPKDHTMMRVPEGKEDGTYKCPIDGTTMEKRKGHGFAFFFDDDEADSL